jgi:hypothetical protein
MTKTLAYCAMALVNALKSFISKVLMRRLSFIKFMLRLARFKKISEKITNFIRPV